MRRIIGLLMVVVALMGGSFARAQTSEDNALKIARQTLDLMQKGDFDSLFARFDDAMGKAITKEQLKAGWESLVKQAGDYQGELDHKIQLVKDNQVVTLTLKFKTLALDLIVSVNPKGQIAGLFMRPNANPPTPVGATAEPLPAYVNQQAFGETEVKVGAGTAYELPGTLTLPAGDGKFPAVILVHGSGPNDRDETIGPNKMFRDVAWGLASQGIAVLRYDKRTKVYGATMKPADASLKFEYYDDAVAAFALLQKNEHINPDKIFVLGHSEGGLVAPRIAAAIPKLAGVIFAAGMGNESLPDAYARQIQYIAQLDGKVTDEEQKAIDDAKQLQASVKALTPQSDLDAKLLGAPARYWLEVRDVDPVKEAASLTMPLFVAEGESDYQVTMEGFNAAKASLGSKSNITFKSYPKLNHVFIAVEGTPSPEQYMIPGHVSADFIADLAAWIKSH